MKIPAQQVYSLHGNIHMSDGMQADFRRGISTSKDNVQVTFHRETDHFN